MKLRNALMVGTSLFALMGLPAVAQAGPNWTGCSIGVQGGMQMGKTDLSVVGSPFALNGLGDDGIVGGVHADCLYQFTGSNFVLGAYGNVNWSQSELNLEPGLFNAKMDMEWAAGLKAGVTVSKALIYALVGYTQADMTWSVAGIDPPSFTGIEVGGGIEVPLMPNITLALEYKHRIYETENILGFVDLDRTSDTAMARLSYRFGGGDDGEVQHRPMK